MSSLAKGMLMSPWHLDVQYILKQSSWSTQTGIGILEVQYRTSWNTQIGMDSLEQGALMSPWPLEVQYIHPGTQTETDSLENTYRY